MQQRLVAANLFSISFHLLEHLNIEHWFHVNLLKSSNDFNWPRQSFQNDQHRSWHCHKAIEICINALRSGRIGAVGD